MSAVLVQIQRWVRKMFLYKTYAGKFFLSEHLREYFSNYGAVESVTVKYDKSGRSKGFGFVLFEDLDSTDKVTKKKVQI